MAQVEAVRQPKVLPDRRHLTLNEFLALPGDARIEVSNGKVIEMAANQRVSTLPAQNLYNSLFRHTQKKKLGSVWIETSYVLDSDPRTNWVIGSRTPDVSFVSRERAEAHDAKYGKGGPWYLAPDLAAEVVSPTDSYDDIADKVADYLRYGVKLVWILDPKARTVRVFTADNPTGHSLREGETLMANPLLPGWKMKVADLFAEP